MHVTLQLPISLSLFLLCENVHTNSTDPFLFILQNELHVTILKFAVICNFIHS